MGKASTSVIQMPAEAAVAVKALRYRSHATWTHYVATKLKTERNTKKLIDYYFNFLDRGHQVKENPVLGETGFCMQLVSVLIIP